jgi:Ankyrin repeats (many copies)
LGIAEPEHRGDVMPLPLQSIPTDNGLYDFVRVIVAGDGATAARLLDNSPALVHARCVVGATRQGPNPYFFEAIAHYMYAGDTALHMAAAAHYAADANAGNPAAQAATIDCLIRAGADPNATDKSGVTPLHRAVRTRCAAAVEALLAGGAAPRGRNGSGSTPLHLAVQNTGASHSGTPHAIEQQRQIIALLLCAGATPDDRDENGKAVRDAAKAEWIRALL